MSNPFTPDNNNNRKIQHESEKYMRERFKSILVIRNLLNLKNAKLLFSALAQFKNSLTNSTSNKTPVNKEKASVSSTKAPQYRGKTIRNLGDKTRNFRDQFVWKDTQAKTKDNPQNINNYAPNQNQESTPKTNNINVQQNTALKLAKTPNIIADKESNISGGDVGIAVHDGKNIAAYSIGAVWSKGEKIFEGESQFITKTDLAYIDIFNISKSKKGEVGEKIEGVQDLIIRSDNGSKLLEVNLEGIVTTNNFREQDNLIFFQQNPQTQEKTILVDERIIKEKSNATEMNQENNIVEDEAEYEDGLTIVKESLKTLAENNPEDTTIQFQTDFLETSLDMAEEATVAPTPNQETINIKTKINQNEAGSAIIDLFEQHNNGNPTRAGKYEVERKGNTFFLKDETGNVLLEGKKSYFGTKINQNNLQPHHKQDLQFLKEDLQGGYELSGNFGKNAQPTVKQTAPSNSPEKFSPGNTIVKFFNQHSKDRLEVKTEDYIILREGTDFKIYNKDKKLEATVSRQGNKIVTKGEMSDKFKYDLKVLQGDIQYNEPISGKFKPLETQQSENLQLYDLPEAQEKPAPQKSHKDPVFTSKNPTKLFVDEPIIPNNDPVQYFDVPEDPKEQQNTKSDKTKTAKETLDKIDQKLDTANKMTLGMNPHLNAASTVVGTANKVVKAADKVTGKDKEDAKPKSHKENTNRRSILPPPPPATFKDEEEYNPFLELEREGEANAPVMEEDRESQLQGVER